MLRWCEDNRRPYPFERRSSAQSAIIWLAEQGLIDAEWCRPTEAGRRVLTGEPSG